MKKLIALLLCIVLLCGCAPKADPAPEVDPAPDADPGPVLADCGILHEPEFGGVYIKSTIDEFNALGFSYGDSVNVRFSNGYELTDLPYYNGYYTENGQPLLIAYHGYDYVKAAINNGDDLWTVAGLKETDTAAVTLCERGKYLDIQQARNIHYTDLRSEYPSDEAFANFRAIRAGNIAENTVYRSASPCDNQHNRAPYVDALAQAAGIGFILDLADNADKINGYVSADDFSSPYFLSLYNRGKVEALALNMNFASDEFRQKLVQGLTVMAASDGPYLVHCTEGKDRTGFVCMLLEALAGASYAEIVDDYMITYDNYYKINPSDDKARYEVIVDKVLDPMIRSMAGDPDPDPRTADLSACAEQFLTDAGMDANQIEALRHKLTTTPAEAREEAADDPVATELTGRVVTPVAPMFRAGEPLPDGVYSIGLSADSWYRVADDGTPMLHATVYDYDRYDTAEIESLQRGDQVQSYDQLFTVEQLTMRDIGNTLPKVKLSEEPSYYSLYGNHNLWDTPLLDQEQEEYYHITEHDYVRLYPVGTWDLPIDPDFSFVDGLSWVFTAAPQVREPSQGIPYTLDELREQVDRDDPAEPWVYVTSPNSYTKLRLQVRNGVATVLLLLYHE